MEGVCHSRPVTPMAEASNVVGSAPSFVAPPALHIVRLATAADEVRQVGGSVGK